MSWKPYPDALHVNAFSVDWSSIYFYGFPPLSIISSYLQKVLRELQRRVHPGSSTVDNSTLVHRVDDIIDSYPLVLPRYANLMTLGNSDRKHPLNTNYNWLSGDRLKTETFWSKQPIFCSRLGAKEHKNSISHTLKSGLHSVAKNRLIQLKQI